MASKVNDGRKWNVKRKRPATTISMDPATLSYLDEIIEAGGVLKYKGMGEVVDDLVAFHRRWGGELWGNACLKPETLEFMEAQRVLHPQKMKTLGKVVDALVAFVVKWEPVIEGVLKEAEEKKRGRAT